MAVPFLGFEGEHHQLDYAGNRLLLIPHPKTSIGDGVRVYEWKHGVRDGQGYNLFLSHRAGCLTSSSDLLSIKMLIHAYFNGEIDDRGEPVAGNPRTEHEADDGAGVAV